MPEAYQIPATGTVEYTYIVMPTNFKQDMWVKAAEVRPGNRGTMHHAILFARTPGSKWLASYPTGVRSFRTRARFETPVERWRPHGRLFGRRMDSVLRAWGAPLASAGGHRISD